MLVVPASCKTRGLFSYKEGSVMGYTEYAIIDKDVARTIDYLERIISSMGPDCPSYLVKELDSAIFKAVEEYYGKEAAEDVRRSYTLSINRQGCVTLGVYIIKETCDE